MKIELATIQDVPEILELRYKAFRPVAERLNWPDAPNLTETVEHARGEFPKYTTLKMLSDDGKIIGSVRGRVENGSLYIGRLMVLPEFQKKATDAFCCEKFNLGCRMTVHGSIPAATCLKQSRSTNAKASVRSKANDSKTASRGYLWRRSKNEIMGLFL